MVQGIIWYSIVHKLTIFTEAGELGSKFMNRIVTNFMGSMNLLT